MTTATPKASPLAKISTPNVGSPTRRPQRNRVALSTTRLTMVPIAPTTANLTNCLPLSWRRASTGHPGAVGRTAARRRSAGRAAAGPLVMIRDARAAPKPAGPAGPGPQGPAPPGPLPRASGAVGRPSARSGSFQTAIAAATAAATSTSVARTTTATPARARTRPSRQYRSGNSTWVSAMATSVRTPVDALPAAAADDDQRDQRERPARGTAARAPCCRR